MKFLKNTLGGFNYMANIVLIIQNSDLLKSMNKILANSKSAEKVHELLNKSKTGIYCFV